jgi:hypothetical protein
VQSLQVALQTSYNGFLFSIFFKANLIIKLSLIASAAIIFKQKVKIAFNNFQMSSMVKLDFLAKLRIKNEVSSSDEKLRMLMPSFVLKKMNNFEMTSKP